MQGTIIEVRQDGANPIGVVEFEGKRRAVYLTLIPSASVGDEILFHAGFATECIRHAGAEKASAKPSATLETGGAYRLLNDLEPQQLRKLIAIAQDRHYSNREIIFPSGATSSFLHLIVSGAVALEAVTDGFTHVVQTLHAGDAMGWSAITGDSLTHFQARALSPLTTVALPGAALRALCDADPVLGYELMRRLVELVAERLDAVRAKLSERTLVNAAG